MSATELPRTPRVSGGGVGLALELLEQIARHPSGASAADIARLVGAPRATVYRTLNALVQDEYLVRRPDFTGFMLGARVIELAAIVDARKISPRQQILARARASLGEAVHLLAFHDTGMSVIDEDPRRPLTDRALLLSDPTRSAAGHLWLAGRPPRSPSATRWRVHADADDLAAITAAVAARGYAEQAGLLSSGTGCLAVPVKGADDQPLGAVALATTLAGISVAARHLSVLREAASELAGADALG